MSAKPIGQRIAAAMTGLTLIASPVASQTAGPERYPYIDERQPVRPYQAPRELDPRDVENIALKRSLTALEEKFEQLEKRLQRLESDKRR